MSLNRKMAEKNHKLTDMFSDLTFRYNRVQEQLVEHKEKDFHRAKAELEIMKQNENPAVK